MGDSKWIVEALSRWIHVVAGIAWIGHLFFFNFVNAQFAATLDADSKRKVVPELMPRALWWFRWGAAYTWITGLLLAGLVYYMGSTLWASAADKDWGAATGVLVVASWLMFGLYDPVAKVVKDQRVMFVVGVAVVALLVNLMAHWANWSARGYMIHIGIMFGTIMAANVWMRIWPAQRRIIAAVKAGTAPDAALVASAGLRSRHNTYMSVPLVYFMLGQHMLGVGAGVLTTAQTLWSVPVVTAVGWLLVLWLYGASKKVKGF